MKKLPGLAILPIMAVFCCQVLIAQNSTQSAKPAAASTPQMTMAQPAPEMTKLVRRLSGSWAVAEKIDPSPMFPKGGTGKGTAVLTPGPGGMSLLEKYQSSGAMGPHFTGLGVFWWDAKAQLYHGLWCDNTMPGGCDPSSTTKWEGDKLIGTMTSEMNGQKMTTQYVYSDWAPDSFVMTMLMGPDTKTLKPAMTVTYRRSAAAKPDATPDSMKP